MIPTLADSGLSEQINGLVALLVMLAAAWVRFYITTLHERMAKAEGEATAANKLKETVIVGTEAAGVAMLDNLLAALPANVKAAMGQPEAQKVAAALAKATKGEIKSVAIEAGTQALLDAAVAAITKQRQVGPELAPAIKRATSEMAAYRPDGLPDLKEDPK